MSGKKRDREPRNIGHLITRARRRGDRIAVFFAAVHKSACGTKRTYRGKRLLVRYWSEADIRGCWASIASVVNDPFLPFDNQFCCDAQRGATESSLGISGPIQVSDWPL